MEAHHLALRHGHEENPSIWAKTSVIVIHGILMIIAWAFLVNVGTIVASFYKPIKPHGKYNWFRLHVIFQSVGVGIAFIAFLIAFAHIQSQINAASMESEHSHRTSSMAEEEESEHSHRTNSSMEEEEESSPSHFQLWHPTAGLIVTILAISQVVLGIVIHYLYNPQRTAIPFWDKVHWWMGRTTLALSAITILLGFGALIGEGPSGGSKFLLYTIFVGGVLVLVGAFWVVWIVLEVGNHERSSGKELAVERLRRGTKGENDKDGLVLNQLDGESASDNTSSDRNGSIEDGEEDVKYEVDLNDNEADGQYRLKEGKNGFIVDLVPQNLRVKIGRWFGVNTQKYESVLMYYCGGVGVTVLLLSFVAVIAGAWITS